MARLLKGSPTQFIAQADTSTVLPADTSKLFLEPASVPNCFMDWLPPSSCETGPKLGPSLAFTKLKLKQSQAEPASTPPIQPWSPSVASFVPGGSKPPSWKST